MHRKPYRFLIPYVSAVVLRRWRSIVRPALILGALGALAVLGACRSGAGPGPSSLPTDPTAAVELEPQVRAVTPSAMGASTPAPDTTAILPAPATRAANTAHAVKAGETLLSIALEYDVAVEALIQANGLLDPDLLRIGQKLVIPPAGAPVTPPSTATAVREAALPGMGFACSANATVRSVQLPAEPIRLLIVDETLYLVADGALYGLPLEEASGEAPVTPVLLSPGDGKIGDILIEELVDAAHDPTTGDLLLLDKSNDIYRYTPAGGWQVEVLAQPIPGQFPDPQYLALAALDNDIFVLDADLSHIWRFGPGDTQPQSHFVGGSIADAVDLTIVEDGDDRGAIYVLTRAGRVVYIPPGARGRTILDPPMPVTWPAQIEVVDGGIAIVDGDSRSVTTLESAEHNAASGVALRFANMPRLRSTAQTDGAFLAVAGPNLYAAQLDDLAPDNGQRCPPVVVNDALTFHGTDIDALLADFALPFPNAVLPDRPRSYPGARRLYRFGLHTGMDLYANDAGGLGFGSPVRAIGDGTVIRIDHGYEPLAAEAFDAALDQAEAEHHTNAELFELFMGRQVQIRHSDDVTSYYGHLQSTAGDIVTGTQVLQGTPIGTVGVTGTSAGAYGYTDGAHLHYEIWIGDRYLGQGLSLYETMRLWQAIFNEPKQ